MTHSAGRAEATTTWSAEPRFLLWLGGGEVSAAEAEAVRQRERAVHRGCGHHAPSGGPDGFREPDHLEPGASDLEEVVRSRADAMQTLARNLVQVWKMLPGMKVLFCFVFFTMPVPDVFSSYLSSKDGLEVKRVVSR